MNFVAHDYQKYAIEFIEGHPIAAVLLDMGLGKTIITLTALFNLLFDRFEIRRVLVIAPLRVARETWPAELQKWEHLKLLQFSVAVGSEKERLEALTAPADIYIINRENVQWLIEKTSLEFNYDMIVVDELSSFKSWKSKRFKSLMKMRPKIRRIVGLTGTPTSNGLMDLFAQYKLLDMGARLERFIGRYRMKYFMPDRRDRERVYSYKPLPGAEERIFERISDITISMKATEHLKMPELISNEYLVRMSAEEEDLYKTLKIDLRISLPGQEITAANAGVLSGKLCQMACGGIYKDDGSVLLFHERKLDALEDMIEAANGKPLLVAYWFQFDLERISARLEKLKVSFAKLDSAESIRKWNQRELQVALIHPASAGHGLNLQEGGNTLIWYGLTWSLELYQQTNARLWRQGQRANTVVIQHIVTAGTIERELLEALESKEKTQKALIEAVKAQF